MFALPIGDWIMNQRLFHLVIFAVIMPAFLITSCGKKAKTSEMIEEEKEIKAQWALFIRAIDKQDIELFKSICSKSVLDKRSTNVLEEIMNNSRKSRMGRSSKDYEMTDCTINNDKTEATITLLNKQKWNFIKEDGKWLLKEL